MHTTQFQSIPISNRKAKGKDTLQRPITCTQFEEMKTNLPTSLINRSIYFQTFLFLFTSTTFGFIDFADRVKTREFIPIKIPVNEYILIQPILIKNYHHDNNLEIETKRTQPSKKNKGRDREQKDLYAEPWLDGGLSSNTEVSLEMLKKLQNNKNLFFLGVTPKSILVFSQTKLLKSFNFYLPKFKPLKSYIKIQKEYADDPESGKSEPNEEAKKEQSPGFDLNNEDKHLACIFKRKGLYSTYHESLPQYLFMLIYNCEDQEKRKHESPDGNFQKNEELSQDSQIFSSVDHLNQLKILTFEIISDQFLWVDTVNNIDDNLESYGEMRLFKNFRHYLVSVFGVDSGETIGGKVSQVHVLVKKFDRHSGFLTVLSKQLNFQECAVPYYDILYSYKKDEGQKKFEQENGKYSFNKCYSSNKGNVWLYTLHNTSLAITFILHYNSFSLYVE